MVQAKTTTPEAGDVYIGVYYERPDGRIVYTYGWDGRARTVAYTWDGDKHTKRHTVSAVEFASWTRRPDLKDYPNASNPRLPYVFDLYWDLKRESDLHYALEHGCDGLLSTKELREMAIEYGYLHE